tara:strand:+ start:156 stop:368 length:213 start_codon:yes stop_codon:yes gene_type:complete
VTAVTNIKTIIYFKTTTMGYRTTFTMTKSDGIEYIYAVRHCYKPKATREYKSLIAMLEKDKIVSFQIKFN